MAEPRNALGNIAMETGDFIVEKFGPSAEVGAVLIIADVIHEGPVPDGEESGPAVNHVTYYCNDPRMWVQEALLGEAGEVCTEERSRQRDAQEDAAIDKVLEDADDEEDEDE